MVAWMVALIPRGWRLSGTMEMYMPRELKMTPRKVAPDLQTPCNNVAHFRCVKLWLAGCRLLLIFPSEVAIRPILGRDHDTLAVQNHGVL